MGWSWSVFLITLAQETTIGSRTQLPWLRDKHAYEPHTASATPEPSSGVSIMYVDKFGAITASSVSSALVLKTMTDRRVYICLDHSVEPEGGTTLLGLQMQRDRCGWRPSDDKIRLLYRTLKHIVDNPASLLSGKMLEVFILHYTYFCGLRVEALSIFSAVYGFMRRHPLARVPVLDSVKRELTFALHLLPLLRSRGDHPLPPVVF